MYIIHLKKSAYNDSFTLENLKRSHIIFLIFVLIDYISVIHVIGRVYILNIVGRVSWQILLLLKVSSQCRVLIEGNRFEFPIGVEEIDDTETVVRKTKDGIDIGEHVHARVSAEISALLNGSEEVY